MTVIRDLIDRLNRRMVIDLKEREAVAAGFLRCEPKCWCGAVKVPQVHLDGALGCGLDVFHA